MDEELAAWPTAKIETLLLMLLAFQAEELKRDGTDMMAGRIRLLELELASRKPALAD